MRPLEETITVLSAKLLALDPGPLAELRRMEPGGRRYTLAGTEPHGHGTSWLAFQRRLDEPRQTRWLRHLFDATGGGMDDAERGAAKGRGDGCGFGAAVDSRCSCLRACRSIGRQGASAERRRS